MKKLILNLQWFAEAGSVVNAMDAYTDAYNGTKTPFVPGETDLSTLNRTFADTALLDNARDQLIYTQLGKKLSLPANKGTSMELRRWKTLGRIGKLTEGVIPSGKKMSQVAITITIAQYGDYVAISDMMENHAIDDAKLGALEELGASAGLTVDLLTRNVLLGGTQILFADAINKTTGAFVETPATEAGLQTDLATYNCNLTSNMLSKARTQIFKSAKSLKYSGNDYLAVVHPDTVEDLRRDDDWIEAHKYSAPEEIFSGEVGRLHGIRFLESNLAPVIKKEGQTYATYKTMIFAKDAFAVLDIEGGGMETIIKTPKEVGGPLNQFGTVGVKFQFGARILYQERMLTIWHGSSYSATEDQNIDEGDYTAA
jgi:N4-gp56 family major capsid protein